MWINVNDSLPKIKWRRYDETRHPSGKVTRRATQLLHSDDVLVFGNIDLFNKPFIKVARLEENRRSGKQKWSKDGLYVITHWMPLPAPPTAEKQGAGENFSQQTIAGSEASPKC